MGCPAAVRYKAHRLFHEIRPIGPVIVHMVAQDPLQHRLRAGKLQDRLHILQPAAVFFSPVLEP